MQGYKNCNLCPRHCGIDRTVSLGACGAGAEITAARAALHHWEEPCISGKNGSGTIFFGGCNLGCVYCQNFDLSRGKVGKKISPKRLAEIFRNLEDQGAHNVNLVTPTHFVPSIIAALNIYRPPVVVYNCGGYESPETLKQLEGYVDIYLTDVKYYSPALSLKYSRAEDYFTAAYEAARLMIDQVGVPVYDETGLMKRGAIIRHLCLPGQRHDSMAILEKLAELPRGSFVLSLMSQYTPWGDLSNYPELNRRITSFEYDSVVKRAVELGLTDGYTQERRSAKEEYTPPFDLTGI